MPTNRSLVLARNGSVILASDEIFSHRLAMEITLVLKETSRGAGGVDVDADADADVDTCMVALSGVVCGRNVV